MVKNMAYVYILCDGFEGGMVYEEESVGAVLTEKEAEDWAKTQAEFTINLIKEKEAYRADKFRLERFESHWEGNWYGWCVVPYRVYFYKKIELKIPEMRTYK
jgi:hypothetical protein